MADRIPTGDGIPTDDLFADRIPTGDGIPAIIKTHEKLERLCNRIYDIAYDQGNIKGGVELLKMIHSCNLECLQERDLLFDDYKRLIKECHNFIACAEKYMVLATNLHELLVSLGAE